MPRATGPAADAAIPQPAADTPAPAEPVAQEPKETPDTAEAEAPEEVTGRWEYVSADPLIYASVPVTPRPGDVVAWPGNPVVQPDGTEAIVPGPPATDGRWKATDSPVTRWPDNHPQTLADAEAAQVAARIQPEAPKEA
jgi:hypothetical protein